MTRNYAWKGIFISFSLLLFSLLIIQCTSDLEFDNLDVDLEQLNDDFLTVIEEEYSECVQDIQEITTQGGILSFADTAHFVSVYECLEGMYELYNTLFDEKFSHLTIEELDSLDESLTFDEQFILQNFEDNLGFSSLRSFDINRVNDWLEENENPDWNNDPSDQIPLDDFFKALLNENCSVIVEGIEYNVCENSSLKELNSKRLNVCWIADGDCCTSGFQEDNQEYNNGNNMYRLKVRYGSGIGLPIPWTRVYVKGKIVNYKRKRRRWTRSRTSMSLQVGASVRDNSCSFASSINKASPTKRRKEIRLRPTTLAKWGYIQQGDACATANVQGAPVMFLCIQQ